MKKVNDKPERRVKLERPERHERPARVATPRPVAAPRPFPGIPRPADRDQPEVRDLRNFRRMFRDGDKPKIPNQKSGCSKYFLMLVIVAAIVLA